MAFDPDPHYILNQADSGLYEDQTQVLQEELESATLVLTRPPENELAPYTERNFSPSEKAAIAWWMAPAFMDNTSEFRRYQRSSPEKRSEYDEEKQIFFNFIQDSLDSAENQSVVGNDIILFRGITADFAGVILNNSEYREGSYASTSYDPVVSLDVFSYSGEEETKNLLVLERKAGEHTLYINEDEREYLIPRGSDWQVVQSVLIDNLSIESDFYLYNRTKMSDAFSNVRLIYITPVIDQS
jgi:hypothetical protein